MNYYSSDRFGYYSEHFYDFDRFDRLDKSKIKVNTEQVSKKGYVDINNLGFFCEEHKYDRHYIYNFATRLGEILFDYLSLDGIKLLRALQDESKNILDGYNMTTEEYSKLHNDKNYEQYYKIRDDYHSRIYDISSFAQPYLLDEYAGLGIISLASKTPVGVSYGHIISNEWQKTKLFITEYIEKMIEDNDYSNLGIFVLACKRTGIKLVGSNLDFVGMAHDRNPSVNKNTINLKFFDNLKDYYYKLTSPDADTEFTRLYGMPNFTFMDLAIATITEILQIGAKIQKCKNCGKYFVVQNRSDTLYCDRISPQDNDKTCKRYGAERQYQVNLKNSLSKQLYRKIYMSKQMLAKRNPDIVQYSVSFEKYKTQTKQWDADIKAGTKTEVEYVEWLNQVKEKRVL